jgi:hypothetical protein
MDNNSVTLESFASVDNVLMHLDTTLSVQIPTGHVGTFLSINNILFSKYSQHILYIDISLEPFVIVSFYNDMNRITLVNGHNKININIGYKGIVDIGFLLNQSAETSINFTINKFVLLNKVYDLTESIIKGFINNHFNDTIGFGQYRDVANKLFKKTIDFLDEFDIDYCLISGSLLGYIRHNDFIPWDDDIDLIVSPTIRDKLDTIQKKYGELKFVKQENHVIKSCYRNKTIIESKANRYEWTWPFVDLFIFEYDVDNIHIKFFNKKWKMSEFFPLQKKMFLNKLTCIPNNPDYFLQINYGSSYATILKSSTYCHKYEIYSGMPVTMHIKLLKYFSE